MNSTASQSSSSGGVGQSPCEPRSSRLRASPWPKNSFHKRFTKTRAVSGLSAAVSQRARSRRVARRPPVSIWGRKWGTAGATTSPDSSCQFPRGRRRTGSGSPAVLTSDCGTSLTRSAFRISAARSPVRTDASSGATRRKKLVRLSCCSFVRSARSFAAISRISFVIPGPGSVRTGHGSVVADRRKRPRVRFPPAFWWSTSVSVVSSECGALRSAPPALEGRLEADRVSVPRRLRSGGGGGDEREVVTLDQQPSAVRGRRRDRLEDRPAITALAGEGLLPALLGGLERRGTLLELLAEARDLGVHRFEHGTLTIVREVVRLAPPHRLLLHVREEGPEAVEVLGEVRVEL